MCDPAGPPPHLCSGGSAGSCQAPGPAAMRPGPGLAATALPSPPVRGGTQAAAGRAAALHGACTRQARRRRMCMPAAEEVRKRVPAREREAGARQAQDLAAQPHLQLFGFQLFIQQGQRVGRILLRAEQPPGHPGARACSRRRLTLTAAVCTQQGQRRCSRTWRLPCCVGGASLKASGSLTQKCSSRTCRTCPSDSRPAGSSTPCRQAQPSLSCSLCASSRCLLRRAYLRAGRARPAEGQAARCPLPCALVLQAVRLGNPVQHGPLPGCQLCREGQAGRPWSLRHQPQRVP